MMNSTSIVPTLVGEKINYQKEIHIYLQIMEMAEELIYQAAEEVIIRFKKH